MNVISDPARIRDFCDQLERQLSVNCGAVQGNISFRPQSWPSTVWWDPARDFWFHFDSLQRVPERWWCAYGVSDPGSARGTLTIAVEINFPVTGIDRRIAGAFVEDDQGNVHLVHSGAVGGGRPGISRDSFLTWYQNQGNNLTNVRWGAETREAIVVARLGDPQLADHVAQFVHDVASYKAWVTGGP
jgi:hypothetical protein